MSKIKPILFSTAMVQAILDGRKKQTRRIIKPQPELRENSGFNYKGAAYGIGITPEETAKNFSSCVAKYQIADIIWVREKWRVNAWDDCAEMLVEYANGDKNWCTMYDPTEKSDWICNYADDLLQKGIFIPNDETERIELVSGKKIPWKPSIFMPKEACRLFLECTNVRVERLQDITEADAIAEGVIQHSDYGSTGYVLYTDPEASFTDIDAIHSFESLWEVINGRESWESNPWVWVYDFKRVEKPKDFI